jgi:hypothetical protein
VDLQLTVTSVDAAPIVGPDTPGTQGNRFGFEGGTAQKVGGRYYIFTTEVFDEPKTCASRLVLWDSDDGTTFTRRQVLAETNYDWADTTSHRMSPWSPMSVYDPIEERWSVFFVAYSRKPGSEQPYNMSGLIGRLDSTTPSEEGISGPYEDKGFVDIDEVGDSWEGPARLVSFFPYLVDGRWLAFFGSNSAPTFIDPQTMPQADNVQKILFHVGLAEGKALDGRWTRLSALNPVLMDPEFIENPVVTRIRPDLYAVVYDGANKTEISYAFSTDGITWQPEQLMHLPEVPGWLDAVRTPLGLIAEDDGSFTLYFTAFDGVNPDRVLPLWHDGFGHIGRCRVVLQESAST